jgi:thioester reductase-like protein
MKSYFITGATGVVGSSVVPVLLNDPEARIKLLVRARTSAELAARLEKLYAFWKVPQDDAGIRSRVEALAGDTTIPHLGLDKVAYSTLSANCTHVIHAAGLVRMNLPLEEARRAAVGSVGNIVALARSCAMLQKVDVVSTVGVGGRQSQSIPERWLTEARAFHNTYEQAKAEAEEFLRSQLAQAPMPLTIHRPSMVIGDSRDGRIISFQVFYFLCEFLSGRKTFGWYPDLGEARLDIIGCDVVAETIAAASVDPNTIGRIFHLCSGPGDAPRIADLRLIVRQAFADRGLSIPVGRALPLHSYTRLAAFAARFAPPKVRKALATLPIYLDYLADSPSFDDAVFRGWLAKRGRKRPAPVVYVRGVLDFYLTQRHGPGVARA